MGEEPPLLLSSAMTKRGISGLVLVREVASEHVIAVLGAFKEDYITMAKIWDQELEIDLLINGTKRALGISIFEIP
jgi:hypothetical protein